LGADEGPLIALKCLLQTSIVNSSFIPPYPTPAAKPSWPGVYADLAKRLGEERLRDRLLLQASHWARLEHQGEGVFRIERFIPVDRVVTWLLQMTGLAGMGRRGMLDVRVVEHEWKLPHLPEAFEGFRLLQLTDLHLDLEPALTPILCQRIQETPYDALVVTGDFRNTTRDDPSECLTLMKQILQVVDRPRVAVLGNHDFIEVVPELEEAGLPVLLNESIPLEIGGERIWIGGVDDPHFYKTHDFKAARQNVPEGDCAILLCHSPELAEEAALWRFDLMLSGHTHGGQMCLPGGYPVICPVKKSMPRERILGRWKCGELQGYTSPGTGSCGVAARFNCPPEITVHRLRRG